MEGSLSPYSGQLSGNPLSKSANTWPRSDKSILVIGGTDDFMSYITKKLNYKATCIPVSFEGNPEKWEEILKQHAVVILLMGQTIEDMSKCGQRILHNFVEEGKVGLIVFELISFVMANFDCFSTLSDLLPWVTIANSNFVTPNRPSQITHTVVSVKHPITEGIPATFECQYIGTFANTLTSPATDTVLIHHSLFGAALAVRESQRTRVAQFSSCPICFNNKYLPNWEMSSMSTVLRNTIEWVLSHRGWYHSDIPHHSEYDMLPKGNMNQQLRKAINNKELSDITIILDSETEPSKKTIYASSWLLSLRSEHFHAMLNNRMRESSQKEIVLHEVSYEPFLAVLEYIYTDSLVSDTSDIDKLLDVLVLADRFLLDHLKQLCEHYLTRMLSVETAIYLVSCATRLNATKLKEGALKFIVENRKALQQRPEFANLVKEPEVLLEILKAID